MRDKINIWCENTGGILTVEAGCTLVDVAKQFCPQVEDPKTHKQYPVLAAYVDHKLKELTFRVNDTHSVKFLGYFDADGRRCYVRGLSFLLQKSVRDLFPSATLIVDHTLPSGMYCELLDGPHGKPMSLTEEQIAALEERMHQLVDAELPFGKERALAEDVRNMYMAQGQPDKAKLLESLGKYTCNLYELDGCKDSFHGPLVANTRELTKFALTPFANGFCLQPPMLNNFGKLMYMQRQSKIATALKEYSVWCNIVGINGLGQLNTAILEGKARNVINISETFVDRKYALIADDILARGAKIVFIAGPSSSGKTSSSLRLAQQCMVREMNPKVIELDNYFVPRERTPLDEDGNFDYEALEAMDLELLGNQLNTLLAGGEVELPRFDFKQGRPFFEGKKMHLEENDILIMEGIHALDPAMVPSVDQSRIFRIYASALTSLKLDENCCISTTDNRLLRRMVRDNRVRGITPEDTLLRWPSVRRGEDKYIFPFQENADAQFNTALLYELPLLRYYAEPLLRRIVPSSPAYAETVRLLRFLSYILPLQPSEISAIPPTSILREFIGGQTL